LDEDVSQLEPRSSFQKWTQIVDRKSKQWTPDECEIGTVLQLVYWKFIDIWRQRDAALQSNRLKNLLLANVSHEVRTPLNAIINYLEIALEQPMDAELRGAISQAHQSSKSLIFIINDLLDLTRIEAGKMLFRAEPFSLMSTVRDAAKMFEMDATRKKVNFEIVQIGDIPEQVIGDSSKIRQIVVNLCCNALKFTTVGYVNLFCKAVENTGSHVTIEIAVEDTG
jgi:signal transduction histidine kinase